MNLVNFGNVLVNCGALKDIPDVIPNTVHMIVLAIKILIPVLLIVFGMMDLAKAVMSNDDKVMKEGQKRFLNRCIYAVLVFFIVAVVQFIFSTIGSTADTPKTGIEKCIDVFINGTDAALDDD